MPTLSTAMRNTVLDAGLARLNGGNLVFGTTGMGTTLSTHTLSATAFGRHLAGVRLPIQSVMQQLQTAGQRRKRHCKIQVLVMR
jgi:hypothetical protein